jgi:predicted RNA-binding Zn-ribbon protein involved in translation (DUF1610 family)
MWSRLKQLLSSNWEIKPITQVDFPIHCDRCDTPVKESSERELGHRRVKSTYTCPSCDQEIYLKMNTRKIYLKNGYWDRS